MDVAEYCSVLRAPNPSCGLWSRPKMPVLPNKASSSCWRSIWRAGNRTPEPFFVFRPQARRLLGADQFEGEVGFIPFPHLALQRIFGQRVAVEPGCPDVGEIGRAND